MTSQITGSIKQIEWAEQIMATWTQQLDAEHAGNIARIAADRAAGHEEWATRLESAVLVAYPKVRSIIDSNTSASKVIEARKYNLRDVYSKVIAQELAKAEVL